MNSYIYDKVCVYNGVYEGNTPVSMIHLYTRGSGLILGERPIEFIQKLSKQIFTKGFGTYTYMEAHGIFWEDLKKTFIFDLLFRVKKQTDRGMYKKCMYKKAYNEIPNFMYGNETYTYVEAHVLFT